MHFDSEAVDSHVSPLFHAIGSDGPESAVSDDHGRSDVGLRGATMTVTEDMTVTEMPTGEFDKASDDLLGAKLTPTEAPSAFDEASDATPST